jgi:hypothetical protein
MRLTVDYQWGGGFIFLESLFPTPKSIWKYLFSPISPHHHHLPKKEVALMFIHVLIFSLQGWTPF